ncbi:trigger factor [Brackiella oedipodis]|uniref:trigger factor n=1 Tax=Brackiella oedipodis TaxID=124225 RepID=UPI00048CD188|nr:trigger factor [Brackiella oedipodis]
MQVQKLEGLQRQVDLIVSSADIEAEVKKQLQQVARKAKVQGFRPGKAPLSVIERSHGPSVRFDVINQKVGEAFSKAVQESDLKVAGQPSIEPKEAGDEKGEEGQLAFTAKFEVFPEIELPDLSQVETTKYECKVTDAEVQDTLDILRKQRAQYQETDRASQAEDRCTVDFVGRIDGEEFEGGKASDFVFLVGQGQMLPEFDKAAQGLKKGEETKFDLAFPEDYHGKEVAGKTAEFTLTMKKVEAPVLPEIDSEFAKSLGQEEGDIEKLKAEIKDNIAREAENRAKNRTKSATMDAIAKATNFDVPAALVQNEVAHRIQAAREELKARGVPNPEQMDLPAELFKAEAERRVRLGLLVSELVEKENLQAKPEQVKAKINEFAQNYEKPEEVVTYYLTDAQRRAEIEALVLEDNVIDFVLSKAKVKEEEIPFKEIMGQA